MPKKQPQKSKTEIVPQLQSDETPKPKPRRKPQSKKIQEVLSTAVTVTSPPKQLNAKDWAVSGLTSLGTVLLAGLTSCWSLIAHLLDVTADSVITYLRTIPKADRPSWLAVLSFFAMGLIILNKRRMSAPAYAPPTTPTNLPVTGTPPVTPSPVVPPATGPLPPGTSPPTQPSAF